MPNVLTVRMSPAKLAKLDRRAAQAGRERSEYVRALIEQDLKQQPESPRHVFASGDLVGTFAIGVPTDNRSVRRLIRQRLRERHAKNR